MKKKKIYIKISIAILEKIYEETTSNNSNGVSAKDFEKLRNEK